MLIETKPYYGRGTGSLLKKVLTVSISINAPLPMQIGA
jgi:hypothetical protein